MDLGAGIQSQPVAIRESDGRFLCSLDRWTSADKWLGDIYRPFSLNRYLYCEHEPVNAVDPDGRRRIIIDKIEIDLGSIKLGGKIDPPFKIVLPPVPPWIGRLGQAGAIVGAAVVGWEIGDYIADNYIPREWYERAGEWLYNLWPGIWHLGL